MAIWDRPEETIITQSADSRKCLSCGDNLIFVPKEGKLMCHGCGNTYYPEVFDVNTSLIRKSRETSSSNKYANIQREIICNSCGATVFTDRNTMSTFCAFCGSPAVVENNSDKEFSPEYIIPFKLTRDEAQKAIEEWISKREYLPLKFHGKATYSKITGLYVPLWAVDADCHMCTVWSGIMHKSHGGEYVSDYYDVKREYMFRMANVPFDGVTKLQDTLMEAIEPFDYSEMVPFNISYLQGFYADDYDESPVDLSVRITNRFRDYMYEAGKEYMGLNAYQECRLDSDFSKVENFEFKYVLAPVWVLVLNYKGICYKVLVNGQTGEVAGTTPVDTGLITLRKIGETLKTYSLVIAGSVVCAFLLALFEYYISMLFLFGEKLVYKDIAKALIPLMFGGNLFFLLIPLIVNALGGALATKKSLYGRTIQAFLIKRKDNVAFIGNDANDLDKMPDTYEYLVKNSIRMIYKEDLFSFSTCEDSMLTKELSGRY